MIHIAITEDHQIVRQGLVALLSSEPDMTVTFDTGRATAARDAILRDPPDIALLDINLPGVDGFDLAETLLADLPGLKILFLTSRKDPASVKRAQSIGAKGFLLKDDAFDELANAIRSIFDGNFYISAGLHGDFSRQASTALSKLAPRELAVLTEIAHGFQNKEIADRLGISISTVRTHRARLMEKLDIHSGPELVRFAIDHGIVE